DHADDAAARQREIELLDQQVVGVALLEVARFDDGVAEPWTWRDVDLRRLDFLSRVLLQQVVVGVQPRLAFGLTRARRHADPLELALERFLAPRLGFFFLREPVLLLLQPRRIVAFPRYAVAAIELENPAGDVVEKVPVVRDRDNGPR